MTHTPFDHRRLHARIKAGLGAINLALRLDDDGIYRWYRGVNYPPLTQVGSRTVFAACEELHAHYKAPDWRLEIYHGRQQLWP